MGRDSTTWTETEINPEFDSDDTDASRGRECPPAHAVGSVHDIRFDAFASDIGPFESPRYGWWGRIARTEPTADECRPIFGWHWGPYVEPGYQYRCAGCGESQSVIIYDDKPDPRPFCIECFDKW